MRTASGTAYCDVIGCGRNADFLNVPNPFDSAAHCDFCIRCHKAGRESVEKGYSEIPEEIYYHYYGQNWIGPHGYRKAYRRLKGE